LHLRLRTTLITASLPPPLPASIRANGSTAIKLVERGTAFGYAFQDTLQGCRARIRPKAVSAEGAAQLACGRAGIVNAFRTFVPKRRQSGICKRQQGFAKIRPRVGIVGESGNISVFIACRGFAPSGLGLWPRKTSRSVGTPRPTQPASADKRRTEGISRLKSVFIGAATLLATSMPGAVAQDTAEAACRGPAAVTDFCNIQAIDNGVPMLPQGGGFQSFVSEPRKPSPTSGCAGSSRRAQ
jgi:hypothetical protein